MAGLGTYTFCSLKNYKLKCIACDKDAKGWGQGDYTEYKKLRFNRE